MCFFSSSSFYGAFNLYSEQKSSNSNYYVRTYKHLPASPVSIYEIIKGNKYFFVLYDKNNSIL